MSVEDSLRLRFATPGLMISFIAWLSKNAVIEPVDGQHYIGEVFDVEAFGHLTSASCEATFTREQIRKEIEIRERKILRCGFDEEDERERLLEELEQVRYAFGIEKREDES